MGVVVRCATTKDIGILAKLNKFVQDLHVGAEPNLFRADSGDDEVQGFFAKIIIADKMFVFIAEMAGRPVGYAWFELQERSQTPFTNARTRIYIHHIVVVEDSRKLGVGSSLLNAAEAEAQARGINQVVLDTWIFNEAAQKFFHVNNFETYNIVMRKELSKLD